MEIPDKPNFKKVYVTCHRCHGVGYYDDHPLGHRDCEYCGMTGMIAMGYNDDVDESILDKVQELKTKINQMQADINYIKAKVG